MSNNRIMDFRNTVEAIVNDKIIEPIRENKLVIRELKENSHNKEIIITNLDANCHAFKMDLEPRQIYLFKETIKVNDELLLVIEQDKIVVYIIELKSKNTNKAKEQIRFGRKYADFLIGIIEEQMRYVFPVKEYRGYIFTTKPTGKNTMKGEKYLKCDSMVDDIFIKFFSRNTPHDFRKLSLPFKNVG